MRKALRCWALLCALLASLAFFLTHAEEGLGHVDKGGFTETFTHDSHKGSTRTDLTVVSTGGSKALQ